MIVYLKDEITGSIIVILENIQCVYGNELLFKRQKDAKQLASYLSTYIRFRSEEASDKQITYAADLANGIVIAQRYLTVIVSEDYNKELFNNYNNFIRTNKRFTELSNSQ